MKDNFSPLFLNPLRDKRAMIKRGVNNTCGTSNDREKMSLLGRQQELISLDTCYGGCRAPEALMTEIFTFRDIYNKTFNEMITISVT